jgi:protein-S-isoprenylcysteine O-methyltransferase Ste14
LSPTASKPILAHSRLSDLAAASPLILLYGLASFGTAILIARQWPEAHDAVALAIIVTEAVSVPFFGLQIALCFVRHLPVMKSEGLAPRVTALLASNFNLALLFLPRVTLHGSWLFVSSITTIGGTVCAIAVLAYLGRSFSILPEARKLVANGPYRIVRHPLYLAEMIATLGIMLGFRQPWAVLIAIVSIALQLRRMGLEEDVLRRSFPEYAEYARSTAKLLPGIY